MNRGLDLGKINILSHAGFAPVIERGQQRERRHPRDDVIPANQALILNSRPVLATGIPAVLNANVLFQALRIFAEVLLQTQR